MSRRTALVSLNKVRRFLRALESDEHLTGPTSSPALHAIASDARVHRRKVIDAIAEIRRHWDDAPHSH